MESTVSDELTGRLLSLIKNEIRIVRRSTDGPLSAAASKLGGVPAVPAGFDWPCYSDPEADDGEPALPLCFMAQINLEDTAGLDPDNILPKSGLLSFFYELETMTWGFSLQDAGSARVFYFPDADALSPAEPPEGLQALPEDRLIFEKHPSLPAFEEFDEHFREDGVEPDFEEYCDRSGLLGCDQNEDPSRSKLLGYPDLIQSPMQEDCERIARGYGCGSPEEYNSISESEANDIHAHANDWILLLQLSSDTDGDSELMFGDCGNIYFWIRKEDLSALRFDRIWLVLQCY